MLTEMELELINEAMRRYGNNPTVIACNNPDVIARVHPEVISALWVYGTNPALDLALELRRLQRS
jgi:hypothetical protein